MKRRRPRSNSVMQISIRRDDREYITEGTLWSVFGVLTSLIPATTESEMEKINLCSFKVLSLLLHPH